MSAKAMTWSTEELRKIVAADDLHISPFRDDGVTYGTPTWKQTALPRHPAPARLSMPFGWLVVE